MDINRHLHTGKEPNVANFKTQRSNAPWNLGQGIQPPASEDQTVRTTSYNSVDIIDTLRRINQL